MSARLSILMALWLAVALPGFVLGEVGVGEEAPDFTVQNLGEDGEGGEMASLSDHAGKIVIIDFWMYNCGPCHRAVPYLESDIWQVYKDRGVVVWGVDVDPTRDDFSVIQGFKEQHGLTYQLSLDLQRAAWAKYSSGCVPTMYIIDRDGIVRFYEVGFDKDAVIAKIEELLALDPQGPTFELRLNKMEATPYHAGDTLTLTADVTNPGQPLPVVIYVAIEMNKQFFFWPSYSTFMEGVPFTLPDGMVLLGYPLESVTFDDTFPPGTYTWYGVIADTFGQWITTPSVVTWTFGGELP